MTNFQQVHVVDPGQIVRLPGAGFLPGVDAGAIVDIDDIYWAAALADGSIALGARMVTGVPVALGLPVITGIIDVGETLAVDAAFAYSPTSYAYQWTVNGAPIAGATAPTFAPNAMQVGALLSVTITAANGFGTSAPVTSAEVGPVLAAEAPYSQYVAAYLADLIALLPVLGGGYFPSSADGLLVDILNSYYAALLADGSIIAGTRPNNNGPSLTLNLDMSVGWLPLVA